MSQSRLKAFGLLVAVFALGAVAGGAGLSWAEHRSAAPSRPTRVRDAMLTRMTAQLDLTQEQQDSIRAILKRHDPMMDSMWSEIRPRFDSLRAVVRGDIQGQLTPEQQRKYKEMLEQREREYRERRAASRD
ncbi:MAG: periplasmic heavy metal sensor [Gemmatimonadota bacterium]|jgi:Spy/CpxP family protein refolding chaperone|nr:periplasmic heavy metal sensor [Gemmatimonadota bacterium]